jgi:hypothetical protein
MFKDTEAMEVCGSLMHIKVGSGRRVLFLRDRWINGRTVLEIAPTLFQAVSTRMKNSRTVEQALVDDLWVADVVDEQSMMGAMEGARLWMEVRRVIRDTSMPDEFTWPACESGQYTARDTYIRLTQGGEQFQLHEAIWKSPATPKSKLFIWLAAQHQIWTSDRRARHNLQDHPSSCFVCLQEEDNAEHILMQCVFAREVWHTCGQRLGFHYIVPSTDCVLEAWWTRERWRFGRKRRKHFDALVCTICHALWQHRNEWVFGNTERQHSAQSLAGIIVDEYKLLLRARGVQEGDTDVVRE